MTKIEKILKLGDELNELIEQESEEYKKSFANAKKKITIVRSDGEKVETTEEVAFGEIYRMSGMGMVADDAIKALQPKYKKLFKVVDEKGKKMQEANQLVKQELGFDPAKALGTDFVRMIVNINKEMLSGLEERIESLENNK